MTATPGSEPRPAAELAADLARFIRDVPGFPKPGILFKDIMPLLRAPEPFAAAIGELARRAPRPEAVVAIESRGFVFGTGLALYWKVPLVLARKFGKLPGPTVRHRYALEYGEDTLELQADALEPGRRVAVVDDVLATGGTAAAVAALVGMLGAKTEAMLFLIELDGLGGRGRLAGHRIEALLTLPA